MAKYGITISAFADADSAEEFQERVISTLKAAGMVAEVEDGPEETEPEDAPVEEEEE